MIPPGAPRADRSPSPEPGPPSPTRSTPAGSPIYNREFGVRINYQSIGSGGGIRQMIEGTVDFGATDAPLTEETSSGSPGR
jgi:hypothetical protein